MLSIVRVQSISPRPQFTNFSHATVPLRNDSIILKSSRFYIFALKSTLYTYLSRDTVSRFYNCWWGDSTRRQLCLESVPAGNIWGRNLSWCLLNPAVRLDHLYKCIVDRNWGFKFHMTVTCSLESVAAGKICARNFS